MDTRWEFRKFRLLFVAAKAFLLGLCLSHAECNYAVSGRNAVGTVTRVVSSDGRFGGKKLTVEYEFSEPDGTRRRDNDTVPTNWQPPPDNKIAIRYTPGETGQSRLAGHVSWWGLGVFGGSILLFVLALIVLGREGRELPDRK